MSFDPGIVNKACLDAFGQAFTFTPAATGDPQAITAILVDSGIEPEESPPADGSTYAQLWLESVSINPRPEKGDEIASGTTVYKIVRIEEDAGKGLRMLLRQDRTI
jgi:hypothetical protein